MTQIEMSRLSQYLWTTDLENCRERYRWIIRKKILTDKIWMCDFYLTWAHIHSKVTKCLHVLYNYTNLSYQVLIKFEKELNGSLNSLFDLNIIWHTKTRVENSLAVHYLISTVKPLVFHEPCLCNKKSGLQILTIVSTLLHTVAYADAMYVTAFKKSIFVRLGLPRPHSHPWKWIFVIKEHVFDRIRFFGRQLENKNDENTFFLFLYPNVLKVISNSLKRVKYTLE